MILNKLPQGGGGAELQIGDITQKDMSGDSNFLKCDGQRIELSNYAGLNEVMGLDGLDINTIRPTTMSSNIGKISTAIYFNGNIVYATRGTDSSTTFNIYNSPDLTFTTNINVLTRTNAPSGYCNLIKLNNKLFAMLGAYIYSSDDGVNWTLIYSSALPSGNYMSYFKGQYIIFSGAYIYTSPDLSSWTQRVSNLPITIYYADDFAVGADVILLYNGSKSLDGITWTVLTSTVGNLSVIYNPVQNNFLMGTHRMNNVGIEVGTSAYAAACCFKGNYISYTNVPLISTNGATWSSKSLRLLNGTYAQLAGNGTMVGAVSDNLAYIIFPIGFYISSSMKSSVGIMVTNDNETFTIYSIDQYKFRGDKSVYSEITTQHLISYSQIENIFLFSIYDSTFSATSYSGHIFYTNQAQLPIYNNAYIKVS